MSPSGPRSIPWRLYHLLYKAHMAALRRIVGERPVPLGYWRALSRLTRARSSYELTLSPSMYEPEKATSDLGDPELRALFAGHSVGSWALDVDTIEYISRELRRQRPSVVIECGAGSSTHLFAAYFARQAAPPPARAPVISLEQDPTIARSVEDELRRAGLEDLAKVLHSPLDHQHSYSLDAGAMAAALADRPADWVFVDGPAGYRGCRWRTLIDLMGYARTGTRWYLHDALRLDELGVLSLWERYPGIAVEGIVPIGKGLATGTLNPPGGG